MSTCKEKNNQSKSLKFNPDPFLHYTLQDDELIMLLAGGDKSSQTSDIAKAKQLAKELQDEQNNHIWYIPISW